MTQPSGLDPKRPRASDRDRERTAEILRDAAAEGRLSMNELDERLDAVYAAKACADLELLVGDLPHAGITPARAAPPATAPGGVERFGGQPTSSSAIAIIRGFSRKGAWVVPADFTAVAIMGGGELDLRDARFSERVVTIHAVAILGGIEIIVPDDANVELTGMGRPGARARWRGTADGPTIRISWGAFLGAVDVMRKPSQNDMKHQKLLAERQKPESGELEQG
jgi:hypothetical protein